MGAYPFNLKRLDDLIAKTLILSQFSLPTAGCANTTSNPAQNPSRRSWLYQTSSIPDPLAASIIAPLRRHPTIDFEMPGKSHHLRHTTALKMNARGLHRNPCPKRLLPSGRRLDGAKALEQPAFHSTCAFTIKIPSA